MPVPAAVSSTRIAAGGRRAAMSRAKGSKNIGTSLLSYCAGMEPAKDGAWSAIALPPRLHLRRHRRVALLVALLNNVAPPRWRTSGACRIAQPVEHDDVPAGRARCRRVPGLRKRRGQIGMNAPPRLRHD